MAPEAGLTADQAAVYDRQLRVWGHEVQSRLNAAKVLVIGADGLAAEVCKNLVLAGVGHVAVSDDQTPCAQADPTNFLVTTDAAPTQTVAAACVQTLSAMNPLIHVSTQPLGEAATAGDGAGAAGALAAVPQLVAPYDVVISTQGLSRAAADTLEAVCTEAGKKLFIAEVVGPLSYIFINLGQQYTYTLKNKVEGGSTAAGPTATTTSSGSGVVKSMAFPRLDATFTRPANLCLGRRPTHPLYQVLRLVRQFEAQQGRTATQQDHEALQAAAAALESAEGVPAGTVSRQLLESYLLDKQLYVASAPVAAVAGGVLANACVRAISHVGLPLKNLFFYTLNDGLGLVEDMPGQLAVA